MNFEQRFRLATLGCVLAAVVGCGSQPDSLAPAAAPVDDACSETLIADYVPSDEYGSASPEEALRRYEIHYRGRIGESQSAGQDRREILTYQGWAGAFQSAKLVDGEADLPPNTVRAVVVADGRETASFFIKRADEGAPRWAVYEGWVLLPSEACAPVDKLRRQEQQR